MSWIICRSNGSHSTFVRRGGWMSKGYRRCKNSRHSRCRAFTTCRGYVVLQFPSLLSIFSTSRVSFTSFPCSRTLFPFHACPSDPRVSHTRLDWKIRYSNIKISFVLTCRRGLSRAGASSWPPMCIPHFPNNPFDTVPFFRSCIFFEKYRNRSCIVLWSKSVQDFCREHNSIF